MKKYEKEIREILEKMDSFVPDAPPQEREREREPKKKPTSIGVIPPAPRPLRPKVSASNRFRKWLRDHNITGSLSYLLFGFVFMVCGLIVIQNFGGLSLIGQLLVLFGFVLYVAPVFIRFFGGNVDSNNAGPQFWRGETVDHESAFSWKKLKGLFSGKRGRGGNDPWNRNNRNNRW